MKLKDASDLQEKVMEKLAERALEGDNQAADVLLNHLRLIKQDISKWQEAQGKRKEEVV